MAITSVTTNKSAVVIRRKVVTPAPCTACVDEYALTIVGQTIRQTYAKESRSRPENLLLSPTSRSQIWTADIVYAIGHGRPSNSCTAPDGTECFREYYGYGFTLNPIAANSIWTLLNNDAATGWETKARLQIAEVSQNVAESLFEWRQTAGLVTALSKGMRDSWRAYRDIRKGKFLRKTRLTTCHVASSELVFSFGVAPLLMEVHEAVDRLNNRLGLNTLRVIRGSAYGGGERRLTGNYHWNGYNLGWHDCRLKRRQSWSIVVRFAEPPPQFTMGNPIELAWELTPFSWLVDGVVQIGDWLTAMGALSNVVSLTGTLTTKDKRTVTSYSTSSSYTGVLPGRAIGKGYNRQVLTSIPMPRIPSWSPKRSWRKLMHAVSALRVLSSGCKNPHRTPFT